MLGSPKTVVRSISHDLSRRGELDPTRHGDQITALRFNHLAQLVAGFGLGRGTAHEQFAGHVVFEDLTKQVEYSQVIRQT